MSELIAYTKNHLKQIIPNAKDIFIKIERDHELYRSKIHIKIPGTVIHADKKADSPMSALDSSYQAVLKQIEKFKTKRFGKRKSKLELINS
jgi:ribosomal subunit interface protein